MLTILDLVNHYLGYFTTASKTRGRIYTIVGAGGIWYLLYLAWRFYDNGRWLRGTLLLGLFIGLLYFVILNILYYFTNKRTKWDISPHVEKLLGGPHEEKVEKKRAVIMPIHGLYQRDHVMEASVEINDIHQRNIDMLAQSLQESGVLHQDFGELDETAQRAIIAQEGSISANYPGALVPYFTIEKIASDTVIMAGVNQLRAMPVGYVRKIGLTDVETVAAQYNLAAATVLILGGPSHVNGRRELQTVKLPYRLHVEIAYDDKKG